MIDYLAQVLEEEEQESLRIGGRRVAVRPGEREKPGEEGLPEVGGTDGVQETEEETILRLPAETEVESPAAPAASEEEMTIPEEGKTAWGDWLPRTDGGTDAAAALLGSLRRAGRSVRAIRGGTGVMTVTLPEPGGQTAGPDVEELDRAIQRDARRYDGGFELF